jgi:hypothetical protein
MSQKICDVIPYFVTNTRVTFVHKSLSSHFKLISKESWLKLRRNLIIELSCVSVNSASQHSPVNIVHR